MKQKDIEVIRLYVNGLASDDQKAYVESLFANGDINPDLMQMLEEDWNAMAVSPGMDERNMDYLFGKISEGIKAHESGKKLTLIRKLYRAYAKAAAVLLIPLLVAAGIMYVANGRNSGAASEQTATSTIYAPLGSRVSFNLPDGTTGMLNSGSHLTYSTPFNNNRNVAIEGEAWFDVRHDKKHPFSISAGHSEVRVLGTRFNVNAYPDEEYIEIVLEEGKVRFSDPKTSYKVVMKPSERLIFQSNKASISLVDPQKYSAWTEGQLVFRGDPMEEVARRIERWYNVEVRLADNELKEYVYRGTFEDDSLEEVFRFLSMTSPIRFEIKPREMKPDGSFSKEVVTVHLIKHNPQH